MNITSLTSNYTANAAFGHRKLEGNPSKTTNPTEFGIAQLDRKLDSIQDENKEHTADIMKALDSLGKMIFAQDRSIGNRELLGNIATTATKYTGEGGY